MNTPLTDLTLPVVNDEGEPLDPRVKDAASLRSLWVKTRDADLQSNRMMAKVQALLDGEPPLPQEKLNEMGQGYLSNFNPGDAKTALAQATAAYVDMLAANPQIFDVFTTFGESEAEAREFSEIMSEELGYTIRSWPDFIYRWAYIVQFMKWNGIGVTYFSDRQDWRWNVTHLGYFKVPRQTKTSEDSTEYAFVKVETEPHTLLRYIKDPEYAKEAGWNVDCVRAALMNTRSPTYDVHNWLEFEARWKNNDLVEGETAPSISIIHAWVRECDGSYSTYQFTESPLSEVNGGSPKDGFLLEKRHAFKCANEAFVYFAREIGTNGTIHSVRGMGHDMFNAFQAKMRLINRQVDLAFAAGPVLQAQSEEAIEDLQMTPFGPYMLVSSGVEALQGINTPNLNNSIQPAINALDQTISKSVGTYAADIGPQSTRERSKFEAMAEMEQAASLSVTDINLFYQPADRLAREVVRRMTASDYRKTDPGGDFVWDWRLRCLKRGVPAAAFDKIDHKRTRAARVVGLGSPAARRVKLQTLLELFPNYDQYGKQRLVRDVTASVVGWEQADIYSPKPSESERPPIDYSIAALQNAVLATGQEQPILPNENKSIHLEVHIGKIGEYIGAFEQAGQNHEMFPQIVPPMQMIYDHAAQTLEGYTGPEAPQYRQALQQAGEILVNGIRHLQKLEQMAQMAQPEGAMPQQQGITDDLERKVIEHQVKLQQAQAEFMQKQEQRVQEAALKRSLQAMQTAADIARKNASARAQQGL